jgi:hypothetical protein
MVSFRSLDRVRERLFGPASKPDVKIPGKEKASRLGEPGRLFLHQCVAQFRAQLLPETTGLLREFFGAKFFAAATKALCTQLAAYEPRLLQKQQELGAVRTRLLAVAEPLRLLITATTARGPQLGELGKAFDHEVGQAPARDGAKDKDVVIAPQAPRTREGKADGKPTPIPQPGTPQPAKTRDGRPV